MRKKSFYGIWNMSSSNLGSCPVPVIAILLTMNGGRVSVKVADRKSVV